MVNVRGQKKVVAEMKNFCPMNERDFGKNRCYRLRWLCLNNCTAKHAHHKQTYACIIVNLGSEYIIFSNDIRYSQPNNLMYRMLQQAEMMLWKGNHSQDVNFQTRCTLKIQ